jgi:hypothetical protein
MEDNVTFVGYMDTEVTLISVSRVGPTEVKANPNSDKAYPDG